jgi:hypothetical protein
VRDLAASGSRITRLDLLYVMYCDASPSALFGEIRIGEPQPAGLLVSARSITWSPTWIGGPVTAPIYIRNRSAKRVTIGQASVAGFSVGDFFIVDQYGNVGNPADSSPSADRRAPDRLHPASAARPARCCGSCC